MTQSISVSYTSRNLMTYEIPLCYQLAKDTSMVTLNCAVNMTTAIPTWLQIKKFEITAQLEDGKYMALYNADNDSRNMDCSLFIDKAYAAIMRHEKLRVQAVETV